MLYSEDLLNIIESVAKKHELHIDQMSTLDAEVSAVLRGSTETKDFPEKLMDRLDIDRLKADAIAQDMNDLLFVKIRDAMKEVTAKQDEARAAQEAKERVGGEEADEEVLVRGEKAVDTPPLPPAAQSREPLPAVSPATDTMLHEATTTVAPAATPDTYKADPYREPVE